MAYIDNAITSSDNIRLLGLTDYSLFLSTRNKSCYEGHQSYKRLETFRGQPLKIGVLVSTHSVSLLASRRLQDVGDIE